MNKIFAEIKLVLLLVIIAIIGFIACKKEPDKVGVSIRPEEDVVNALYYDTTSIIAYSVLEDSVRTDETKISLLGSYLDPVFGKTTANIYTQLRLSENGYDFGDNPVLDSLVLSMDYNGYYGDTNTQLQIKIYQLGESMFKDSVYYSIHNIPNEGVELANLSFYPKPTQPVAVGDDTIPAQLRIQMSEEFGNALLNASSSVYLDNESFQEFFKGFYMATEAVGSDGSILYFDLLSTQSKMVIYYRNDEQDSLQFTFVINDNCARFMNYNHYEYIDANPDFKAQVLNGDTSLGDQQLFLQAMGGVKTLIKFPYIKNLVANGRVAVNEAKFVINDVEETEDYPPPGRLVVVGINEEGKNYILPDQFEFYYGGYYDTTKNQVIFRITRYIQSLLEEDARDYGLYLFIVNASLVANRQIVNGPIPNPPIPYSKRLKLNLTYTPVE
ncbi:MAG: DUF4270 domain-containing protein [Bacteroidota bacterium]|nr:DUF4270 domain-containing protein [Bacteroidota bacterium]